jgi:large conductance mechanosensitive channel
MNVVKRTAGVMKEFRAFALRANAIDLAVAVVIGAAFTAVITSLVKNIFTPLIAAIFHVPDFASLSFNIGSTPINYGAFLNALITFILVAFIVFFLIVKPSSAARRRLGWDPAEEPRKSPCPECTTEIPVEAKRCPACTSQLGESWAPDEEPATA